MLKKYSNIPVCKIFFLYQIFMMGLLISCHPTERKPVNPSVDSHQDQKIEQTLQNDSIQSTYIDTSRLFDAFYHQLHVPNKKALGKDFYYQSPRYIYDDPSGKWNITERPKNIFTYRNTFLEVEYKNHSEAFRIDFVKKDEIITLDLDELNPYADKQNKKYRGPNTSSPDGIENHRHNLSFKELVNRCDEYYTNNTVWESNEDYVSVIFEMIAFKNQQKIGNLKSIWVFDSSKRHQSICCLSKRASYCVCNQQ